MGRDGNPCPAAWRSRIRARYNLLDIEEDSAEPTVLSYLVEQDLMRRVRETWIVRDAGRKN